jgi:hypothetical protein
MNKENLLFSIVGVLLGFIVGFTFANAVNQRGNVTQSPQSGQQMTGLPPDHPPIGGEGGLPRRTHRAPVAALLDEFKLRPQHFEDVAFIC